MLTTTPGALQSKSCGSDCSFVTELSQDGTGLIYSTFLGGNAITQASSIALDPSGSVWVAGVTTSTDFPSPSRQAGAFVVKINASGTGITGSLLFGGGFASLLGFDELGNAYVSGTGTAGAFSVTPNALLSAPCSPSAGGGQALLKLDPTGKVLYASFVRQVVYTPAVLPSGTIQGITEDPYQGYNVSRIDLAATPKLNFSCPVNGASWRVPDGLAPGEIVSIFGSNLGPEAGAMGQLEANGRVSSSLAGTQVLFMAFRLHCCMHNPGRSMRLCRSRLIKLRRAW